MNSKKVEKFLDKEFKKEVQRKDVKLIVPKHLVKRIEKLYKKDVERGNIATNRSFNEYVLDILITGIDETEQAIEWS